MKYNLFKEAMALCIIFLVSLPLQANKEWKPGYIITLSNDTLNGWVAFHEVGNNWKYCNFRTGLHEQEQVFTPYELRKYGVDSAFCYKSLEINNGKIEGKYFVRSLVEGVRNLSFLEMEICADSVYKLYIAENTENGKITFLPEIKKKETSYNLNRQRMKVSLDVFLGHHELMQEDLNRLQLSPQYLTGIFQKYNVLVCHDGGCVVYAESARGNTKYYLAIQTGVQWAGVPGNSAFASVFGLSSIKMLPMVGVTGSITLSKYSERALLNVGLAVAPV